MNKRLALLTVIFVATSGFALWSSSAAHTTYTEDLKSAEKLLKNAKLDVTNPRIAPILKICHESLRTKEPNKACEAQISKYSSDQLARLMEIYKYIARSHYGPQSEEAIQYYQHEILATALLLVRVNAMAIEAYKENPYATIANKSNVLVTSNGILQRVLLANIHSIEAKLADDVVLEGRGKYLAFVSATRPIKDYIQDTIFSTSASLKTVLAKNEL